MNESMPISFIKLSLLECTIKQIYDETVMIMKIVCLTLSPIDFRATLKKIMKIQ